MTSPIKTILVTGASSGIGRATALRLAHNGWRVFAAVRKDVDAKDLEAEAKGTLETVRLDVVDHDSVYAAAREVEARLQGRGLDGLFNNAGIGLTSPIEHTTPATLRQIYEINLFGQIDVIQAFLPLIRRAQGRIINAGSVGDHLTPPFGGAMASSKAAFASMRRMAQTFARNEHAGSPPEVVAEVVERALTERNPKTRYPAGKDALKLTMLARLLPEKLLDLAILRTFGLPTAFGLKRPASV
jgi:NAD(P)-dependent dehydrogenase (short-subunit alcohol dehydrogenase family)